MKVNQIIEPNVEPQVAKLTTMFAAGDAVDVSQSPMQYLANYIDQGIAQPIDGLPGVDQYIRDFTPFTRAIAQRDGKTWGLPYFSTVWTFMYNDELLGKAGFKDKPFRGYPELVEQARKAKKDGVAKYPILWIGGQGFEQLPGTWFSLTCNRGGVIFDKQLVPQLGPGSVARETLRWWQSTFKEELADPASLNLRFIPAVKAFNAGQHVYLGTLHHYYISLINDTAQSPIAGKGRVLGHPGDGKTIGYTMLYILTAAPKNREWAWKLLQYLGGRTKDGQYTQANRLASRCHAGQRVPVGDGERPPEEGLVEVGRRPDDSRCLEQGDELRRGRARRLAEVVSALERADERRADGLPAGQAHRRPGLRQHDRGGGQSAEGVAVSVYPKMCV